MKKKVTSIQEMQAVMGKNSTVFETAKGGYAMHWGCHSPFILILPQELDTDEWGDMMSPLDFIRGNGSSPFITESNLVFKDENPVFYWCILRDRTDKMGTYLYLCEPKDATHLLVLCTGGAPEGRPLSADDSGSVRNDLEIYHEYGVSCFLMPVGYIRLRYLDDKDVSHYSGGFLKQEELEKYYRERAQKWQTEAQNELESQRTRIEHRVEEIQRAQQFREEHKAELEELQRQHKELYLKAIHAIPQKSYERDTYFASSDFSTRLDKQCGTKMRGFQKTFDFSEQGLKDFFALIATRDAELEAKLQKKKDEDKHKAVKIGFIRAAIRRRICVKDPGETHTQYRMNYRKIWVELKDDEATLFSLSEEKRHGRVFSRNYAYDDAGFARFVGDLDMLLESPQERCRKVIFGFMDALH